MEDKNTEFHTPVCPFIGFYKIPIIDEKGKVEYHCLFPHTENKCPYILVILEKINAK